ncbi:peptidoglycan DD-metalloendopeptidase family protein [Chryseobacterium sp. PBS4-4]|uniref:Peptidoglycan DD-metalloendopeptidase family protein n=1 Tax=Chryseobacterium edaphi TaxID=2976532 RepID=A0ABT2W9A4_9FLAO|nr:peptidoglycan DD-metalloendopeptidase family protein [Chryseobacterium edaphi]
MTPIRNNIPTIDKVDLLYVDDTIGSTFSFREKLRTKAYCTNMFNKELVFTLWEDDAKGSGHNTTNKPIETLPPKKIDKNGVAVGEFVLTKALMQKAMQGEADPKQLELYVTVEYYVKKKYATENVEINNPFPQTPKPQTKSTPAKPKAKGSPAEQKPPSKKEEKGIGEILGEKIGELWDWWESKGTATKEKTPTVQKPEGKSPAIVKEQNPEKKDDTCVCEKYDLIWGGHPNVDCAFRKKVVEICLDLWGEENKIKMANNLMAVFRWESGGTFKPDVPNQANSGGTGLIQFMPSTAKSLLGKEITIEIVKNYFGKKYNKKTKQKEDWYLKRVKEFADMTAVDQLDYVKKYFEPLRGKSVEFVDFYLQVLFPASSQKEDHIVFASSLDKLTTRTSESDKLRNLRVNAYSQNKGLDNNNDGKVWKSEIKTKVQVYITEGFANKENNFECGQNLQKNTTSEVSKCPEDCSQCLDYADVWENPVISNDNGGKNNNRFGYNSSRGHKGIDILSGPTYKEVHSIMCGEVVSLVNSFKTNEYRSSSLGNTLMIKSKTKDGEIVFILYCHLDKIYVKKGDKIKHGQKVALSGSTGNASYSGLPNGVRGHGIDKANWHCHIEAATKGEGYNNFYSLGSYRVKAEDYMKTKFDKNGNPIK